MWRGAMVLAAAALAGCGGSSNGAERAEVVAAFYPLAWAAQRIAVADADVVNLTPAGGEPHDVELSPHDVDVLRDAELVLYAGAGFQPAVEDAVRERTGPALDVVGAGEVDPHVWLDPVAFAGIAEEIGRALGRVAAGGALASELRELDADFRRGLGSCERDTMVTTHAAFGRLAARYGLKELALAGRAPETEPGPRELEELIASVESSGATTVFAEPLVSDRLAQTIAREAGVDVAVLDPLEGLSQERLDAGEDYLSAMRSNLEALREALGCR